MVSKLPRVRQVKPSEWAAATIIGSCRKSTHDGRRKINEDRGKENSRVELQGAFGDLSLYQLACEMNWYQGARYVQEHMIMSQDQMKKVDAESEPDLQTDSLGIDAKAFDWKPNKRYFALNKRKHVALTGACNRYFCVLARPFAKKSIETFLPFHDVGKDGWSVLDFGRNSDSLGMELGQFLETYCDLSADSLNRFRDGDQWEKETVREYLNQDDFKSTVEEKFLTI